MGILSGLSSLGLSNVEKLELYEEEKPVEVVEKEEEKPVEEPECKEADFLFDKSYNCPICDHNFKTKTVRAGKARMIGSDSDLRPRYEVIDVIKYDTVVCPRCGYSALVRYFKFMTNIQARLIKEGICANYRSHDYNGSVYSYDVALERYKLVLANAIVKKAKPSEKAYICLKSAWLLRGMIEDLQMDASYVRKKVIYHKQEEEYLKNAYQGFLTARSTEPFPLCGMDEVTLDYLLAALAVRFMDFNVANKMISELLSNQAVNPRIKERARQLKEELEREMKKASE